MRPRITRRLAITTVAIAATVAGGAVAAAHVFATAGHNNAPAVQAAGSPQLAGISPQSLAGFGIQLADPAGHGSARITADQVRHVALPLGEGPQSDGWSISGGPVLSLAIYHAGSAVTRTCLCWAVVLNSAHGIPCDTAASAAGTAQLCDDHHLVELIDAGTGGRWLSVSGHGLG